MTGRPGLFLDRDGVILRTNLFGIPKRSARTLNEMKIIGGVAPYVRALAEHYVVLVVTNQPDLARGKLQRSELDRMHAALLDALPIKEIATCPHDDVDGCSCRKPRPGLILSLAARHGIDLQRSWMVGDRASDVMAGRAAGCRTVRVAGGQDVCLDDLADCVVATPTDALRRVVLAEKGNCSDQFRA